MGMHVAVEALRDRIQTVMEANLDTVSEEMATLFKEWIANRKYSAKREKLRYFSSNVGKDRCSLCKRNFGIETISC